MENVENYAIQSIPPQIKEEADAAIRLVEKAESLVISGPIEYEMAGSWLKDIKGRAAKLEDQRRSMTRPLDESKKRIMEWFRRPIEMLARAENGVKRAMIAFTEYEREEAEKARRLLEEKANREAAERKAALEAQALQQIDAGNEEVAERLIAKAESVEAGPVFIQPQYQKVSGISMREVWKFEITNEAMLPREYLMPDLKKIGDVARAGKGVIPIPGVRIYAEQVVSSSRI